MPLAVLPSEIWTRILDNCYNEQALPELWVSQRHTCRMFKNIIEKVFQERALRKTSILFRDISGDGAEVNFKFFHVSEDETVAHFERDVWLEDEQADKLTRNNLESVWTMYLGRDWEETVGGNAEPENDKIMNDRNFFFHVNSILAPPQTVSIHRDVNDTPIPGLRFFFDDFTMTCDWRGLLTRFYGEELRYHNYLERWAGDKKKNMDILKGTMEKGEIDMNAVLQEALGMFAGGDKEAWRVARKARMKKQLVDAGEDYNENLFWQPKVQDMALKRLATNRQMASLETDSDFDEGEQQSGSENDEEDDDEEGEEEIDEWDDVSGDDEDEIAEEADNKNP